MQHRVGCNESSATHSLKRNIAGWKALCEQGISLGWCCQSKPSKLPCDLLITGCSSDPLTVLPGRCSLAVKLRLWQLASKAITNLSVHLQAGGIKKSHACRIVGGHSNRVKVWLGLPGG